MPALWFRNLNMLLDGRPTASLKTTSSNKAVLKDVYGIAYIDNHLTNYF